MIEKKWYKSFRKIIKGIEEEGYWQWKEAVQSSLESIDKNILINTYKRCEIKAECMRQEKGNRDASGIVTIINSLFGAVITFCIAWGGWLASLSLSGLTRTTNIEKALSINLDIIIFTIESIMDIILV